MGTGSITLKASVWNSYKMRLNYILGGRKKLTEFKTFNSKFSLLVTDYKLLIRMCLKLFNDLYVPSS